VKESEGILFDALSAFLEGRVAELEEDISHAVIIMSEEREEWLKLLKQMLTSPNSLQEEAGGNMECIIAQVSFVSGWLRGQFDALKAVLETLSDLGGEVLQLNRGELLIRMMAPFNVSEQSRMDIQLLRHILVFLKSQADNPAAEALSLLIEERQSNEWIEVEDLTRLLDLPGGEITFNSLLEIAFMAGALLSRALQERKEAKVYAEICRLL